MGRVKSATRNIAFGYIGTVTTALMSFVLRTIFIRILDENLVGVNGLYTNILSILSMAELGIGTALNFSLYAPVAKGDTEKIKSYMLLYRKAYTFIAFIVAAIGIAITPFLPILIKDADNISTRDLTLYYYIFLFNTVSTYFVSYKYSLVNAEQKNYIQTNIITITKVITVILQILILVTTRNFYAFLLTDAAVQLIQKIFVSVYLNKLYPYLKDKNVTPLTKEESSVIWSKTRALVLLKVGDVARTQTDSLIISAFIKVAVVGVVDNYNMVLTSISNYVNIIMNSVISSFGNLIATESKEKQYEMFKVYKFFAAWFYGFSATGFFVLLSPLINLWLGKSWLLPSAAVYLILTEYYLKGFRIVVANYRTAAGVFEQDRYLPIVQGLVNLVLSIVLVQKIGITGIYVGTVVSGILANIVRPVVINRVCFDKGAAEYFIDSAKYVVSFVGTVLLLLCISSYVLENLTILSFAVMFVIICVVFNAIFIILFGRSGEFKYCYNLFIKKIRKVR